jgi:hypothetical protein
MTEYQHDENWHLSKAIPISIIFFLALQTVGIMAWAVRLDYRVQVLEQGQPTQDARISALEKIATKVAVMDDRQVNIQRRVEVQTTKLDQILGIILNGKNSSYPKTDNQ